MYTSRDIPSTRAGPHRQEISLEIQTDQTIGSALHPDEVRFYREWGALERDCAGYLGGFCQALRELASGVRESREGCPWWWSVSTD